MTTQLLPKHQAEIITFKVGDEDWRELRLTPRAEALAGQPPAQNAEPELSLAELAIGSCDPFDPLGRLATRPVEETSFAFSAAPAPLVRSGAPRTAIDREDAPARHPFQGLGETPAPMSLEEEMDLLVFPWEGSEMAEAQAAGLSEEAKRLVEAALDRLAMSLEAAEAGSPGVQAPSAPTPPRGRLRRTLLTLASSAAALLALVGGLGMAPARASRPAPVQATPVRSLPTAVAAYQARAEAGDPVAMKLLAFCYQEGLEVPKDPQLARHWLDRAAQATAQERP